MGDVRLRNFCASTPFAHPFLCSSEVSQGLRDLLVVCSGTEMYRAQVEGFAEKTVVCSGTERKSKDLASRRTVVSCLSLQETSDSKKRPRTSWPKGDRWQRCQTLWQRCHIRVITRYRDRVASRA